NKPCSPSSKLARSSPLTGTLISSFIALFLLLLFKPPTSRIARYLPGNLSCLFRLIFGHASKARMHHEQYGRSMKARETAILVERAQCLMRESRKLLEQREALLKQQAQFLEQHATIAHEMLGDTAIRVTAP